MSRTADILRDNDTRLTEFLTTLTDDEWAQPSLCTTWTNHDVLAHLVVGYSAAVTSIAATTLRHRGSFDRANTNLAHALAAARNPAALLNDLTLLTLRARGIGRVFPRRLLLGDHVIHELDIAYTLGRECTIPAATIAAVLDTEVRIPNPFVPAAARARGLNLITTDSTWARRSDGPTVIGRAAHLASVLAGRPWALRKLAGDGTTVLASRLEPSREVRS